MEQHGLPSGNKQSGKLKNQNDIKINVITGNDIGTVLPAKSDSDVMFCLQSYQGLRIDRSLVY